MHCRQKEPWQLTCLAMAAAPGSEPALNAKLNLSAKQGPQKVKLLYRYR